MKWYKNTALVVFNTFLLLIALEAAAAVVLRLWTPADESRLEQAPWYYKNQKWGTGYAREAGHIDNVTYVPYVLWKTEPYQGTYIHVDRDGNRETPGSTCGQHSVNVFVFGGSTVWGDGVPDWGTIPAYLQAELSTPGGRPVCVRNLGQPGWVSTQDVIELQRYLQTGDVPDLAIFYDGFNDVGVLWEGGGVGSPYYTDTIRHRLEPYGLRRAFLSLAARTHGVILLERFLPSLSLAEERFDQVGDPGPDRRAMSPAIVKTYLANCDTVRALAARFGFRYAFFWQPSLDYKRSLLTPQEQQIVQTEETERPGMPEVLRAVYDKVKADARDADHLYFIAEGLQNVAEPVYLDGVHLTHVGNETIASRIVETLRSPPLNVER